MNLELPDELLDAIAAKVAELVLEHHPVDAHPVESWRLLSVEDVAELLGRSPRWVREKAKAGDLPWVRLDAGSLRFDPDDVRAFALARRVPAAGTDSLATRYRPPGKVASGAGRGSGNPPSKREVKRL